MAKTEPSFIENVLRAFKKISSEITIDSLEHDFSPRLTKYLIEGVLGYSGQDYTFERGRTDITLFDENRARAVVIETKRPRESLDAEKWRDQAGKYADASTRFVGLTNGYRFLLWAIKDDAKILKIDLDFKLLIESKKVNEEKVTTQEAEQILFFDNITKNQIWSESKYGIFDPYYAKIDVSEEEGFSKLIEKLNYISNDLLRQYTYSAFDDYYANYAQYKSTKDDLEGMKKRNGDNKKQAQEIARYELKTEGKYKKYSTFIGYYIWKALSNRSDDNEEENKQVFCKESIYVLINRLLFIRICEDKGLLSKKIISNGGIEKLRDLLYEEAMPDNGVFKQIVFFSYNSANNLYYHFYEKNNPLDWYESGDGELDKVINRVLWILNQFNFAKVDRDILGKLYEKYLPKEERKKLGEFYTPDEVIDYILDSVEYMPDKVIESKDLIDPACGSGGFLVRASRRLIARHAVKFGKATPKESMNNKKWLEVYEKLTPKECEEIVNSVALHIHGFDINPFAVSITEMNLLFQIIDVYFKASRGNKSFRVPRFKIYGTDSLEPPIEQTNLIGFNGDTGKNMAKDLVAIEGMKKKKYDFVVGNPPYVRIQEVDERSRQIYAQNYVTAKGNYDLYIPFIELGIKFLAKSAKFGYICSNQFFKRDYGKPLRKFILSSAHISQIVNFKDSGIFQDATNYPAIIVIDQDQAKTTEIISVDCPDSNTLEDVVEGKTNSNIERFETDLGTFGASEWVLESPKEKRILAYFKNCKELGNISTIISGVQTGADRLFLGRVESTDSDVFCRINLKSETVNIEKSRCITFLLGRNVHRWYANYGERSALFPYFETGDSYYLPNENEFRKSAPQLFNYLYKNKTDLDKRFWYGKTAEQLHGSWYAYMYFKLDSIKDKLIVTPALVDRARFAQVDKKVLFALGTAGVFGVSPNEDFHFVLGVLNSTTINFAIKRMAPEKRGGYFQINSKVLSKLPIKLPVSKEEQSLAQRITANTKEILKIKGKNPDADVSKFEKELDELVFDLYGVESKDRRIIEDAAK